MLFYDGIDSMGRPVVVVDISALHTESATRRQAMQYMLHRLEPIITQVCIVCM